MLEEREGCKQGRVPGREFEVDFQREGANLNEMMPLTFRMSEIQPSSVGAWVWRALSAVYFLGFLVNSRQRKGHQERPVLFICMLSHFSYVQLSAVL